MQTQPTASTSAAPAASITEMQVEPTVAAPTVAAEVAPVTAEKEKKRKRKSEAAAEGAVEGAEATVGEDGEKKVRSFVATRFVRSEFEV